MQPKTPWIQTTYGLDVDDFEVYTPGDLQSRHFEFIAAPVNVWGLQLKIGDQNFEAIVPAVRKSRARYIHPPIKDRDIDQSFVLSIWQQSSMVEHWSQQMRFHETMIKPLCWAYMTAIIHGNEVEHCTIHIRIHKTLIKPLCWAYDSNVRQ